MGNNVCCSDSKVDNVTFVSLKPGTFNENKASLFSGQESPDAGYFELENATGKTIAIKVAHGSAPALWNSQPLKDMVVVPPKHHVCAYFDPSRISMEVFVLYGESANVEEAEGVSWARRAHRSSSRRAAGPSWAAPVRRRTARPPTSAEPPGPASRWPARGRTWSAGTCPWSGWSW
ncbi:unnamed protein product [Heterosigma akashiwo]